MFDFEKGRKHDNYFKIVKDEEKFDNISRKVDGYFFMQDSFNLIILTETQDPVILKGILESLPHESMHKFVIEL